MLLSGRDKRGFTVVNPHSNIFHQFPLKLKRWKPHKAACHSTKCDVNDDVKLFPTVLSQIFDVIQSDVSLQSKCIRMMLKYIWDSLVEIYALILHAYSHYLCCSWLFDFNCHTGERKSMDGNESSIGAFLF